MDDLLIGLMGSAGLAYFVVTWHKWRDQRIVGLLALVCGLIALAGIMNFFKV